MAGKTLGDEIIRAMGNRFNHVEPPRKGKVIKVYSNKTVDIILGDKVPGLLGVPVVNCSPVVGDDVIVNFLNGQYGNPVVLGVYNAPVYNTGEVEELIDNEIGSIVPDMISDAITGKIEVDEFTVGARRGCITLSNGLYVEWGYVTQSSYTGTNFSQAINYTHEFNSLPTLQLSHNIHAAYYLNVSATGEATTGFSLNLRRTDTTSIGMTLRWLAIGKRSGY